MQRLLRHLRVPVQQLQARHAGAWRAYSSSHALDRKEVTERVLSVIKDFPKADPAKVTSESHFQKDLGLDSLDTVEIVMALEEEFALQIPDLEADKIDSCPAAIEYVAAHPMAQ